MTKRLRIYTHTSPDLGALSSVWFYLRVVLQLPLAITSEPKGRRFGHEVIFVPANWDGRKWQTKGQRVIPHFDTKTDIALDIEAGDFGVKGKFDEKGKKVHSCFKHLVYRGEEAMHWERVEELEDVFTALAPLVDFIDSQDSTGNGILTEMKRHAARHGRSVHTTSGEAMRRNDIPSSLYSTGLVAVLHAMVSNFKQSIFTYERACSDSEYIKQSAITSGKVWQQLKCDEYIMTQFMGIFDGMLFNGVERAKGERRAKDCKV
jgi:hypothetical protein